MSESDRGDSAAHDLAHIVGSDLWRRTVSGVLGRVPLSDPSVSAEDVAQECFLGLHQAHQRYDPDAGASLLTYAYPWMIQRARRAAQNSALGVPIRYRDSYHSRPETFPRVVSSVDEAAAAISDPGPSPDEIVEQREAYQGLVRHLRAVLSEEQHTALTLFAEGWSMDDIADILNRTPGQVKGLIRMARAVARQTLPLAPSDGDGAPLRARRHLSAPSDTCCALGAPRRPAPRRSLACMPIPAERARRRTRGRRRRACAPTKRVRSLGRGAFRACRR